MKRARFTPNSGTLLALDPKAYGEEFKCVEIAPMPAPEVDGNLATVVVDGPISYDAVWFQSYNSIRADFAEACKSSAEIICMRISSPGGDLFGAFDCARDLRRMADASGKRWVVHVEAECASAAYALASGAEQIIVSSTAQVGSIGVICSFMTAIGAAAKDGLEFTLISSGAYKADGNPQIPIDEPMRARLQSAVDAGANEFFELVAEHRGLSVDAIRTLEAGLLMGAKAVDAGLADAVASWSEYHAMLQASEIGSDLGAILDASQNSAQVEKKKNMSRPNAKASAKSKAEDDKPDQPEDEARAALARKCESEDPVEAARAKRALAAYDEVPEDRDTDEDDDASASAEDDKDDISTSTALAGHLQRANAKVARLEAAVKSLKSRADSGDMASLLASYPHVCADVKSSVKDLPRAKAKAILDAIPNPDSPVDSAAARPKATQGAGQAGNGGTLDISPEGLKAAASRLPSHMQRAFGLTPKGGQPTFQGNRLYVDAPPPARDSQ